MWLAQDKAHPGKTFPDSFDAQLRELGSEEGSMKWYRKQYAGKVVDVLHSHSDFSLPFLQIIAVSNSALETMPGIDSSLKPLPSDHQFTIEEYNYENKTHYQRSWARCVKVYYSRLTPYPACVKASFYFKKRADISHDEFFKHWSHVHSDLTLAAKDFGQCQCQRYTQACSSYHVVKGTHY